jgi:hypothetical protein
MRHLHQGVHPGDQGHRNHLGVVRHQVVSDMDQSFVDRDHLVVDVDRVDQFADLVLVDVQQNRDELNRVLVLTLAGVVRQALQVLVDVDHLKFQMDYFQGVLVVAVDVDQQRFQKDYFHHVLQVDAVLKVLGQQPELLAQLALLVQWEELPEEQLVELQEELRNLGKLLQV